MHFRLTRTAGAAAIATLVALAGAAHTAAQNDLLRGPQAQQERPPGEPSQFAARQGQTGERKPTPAMCHRLLMAAVRSLERTPDLALTGDQREAIEAQHRLYMAALELYRESNADLYDELRPDDRGRRPARDGAGPREDGQRRNAVGPRGGGQGRNAIGPRGGGQGRNAVGPRGGGQGRNAVGPRGGGQGRNAAGLEDDRPRQGARRNRQAIDPEERDAMRAERRERMQALRALEMAAPSPQDIHANIRSLLDPEQEQAVDQRMERLRERLLDRDRRPRAGRPDAGLTDQQRLRIRQAVEEMTPEERREFLETLRERMRERRIEDRPAPPMDEVEIPRPGA